MYNEIKLEKTLYNISGKSFTQALSELDPDDIYKGTELEGLDAYERQLKRFDIKINGSDCDTVDRFFATADSAILFPEFVRRQVLLGFNEAFSLSQFAASIVVNDDSCFSSLSVTVNTGGNTVAEGTNLPTITVKTKASDSASKIGRVMEITYEVLRKKRIDTFAVILKQLGATIARSANDKLTTDVIDSVTTEVETTKQTFNYSTLVELWQSMEGFEMDTILCSKERFGKILQFDEMKNLVATGISAENSTIVTPFGVTVKAVAGMTSKKIIGLSSKYAYEIVYGSDMVVDIGKLISTQYDQIGSSIMLGISRFNDNAVGIISITDDEE